MADCITAYEYDGGIVALDSGMVRPQMAACYLLETDSAVALIEVGNNDSADRIIHVLESRGRHIDEVSHIIVTHARLDHAGGAGELMQRMPNAMLVAHPRAARFRRICAWSVRSSRRSSSRRLIAALRMPSAFFSASACSSARW